MNKHIFIINGRGGVGKDTFCNFVKAYSARRSDSYSSVQWVKHIAKACGWDGESKTEKDRKFLSDLKDLMTEYNDLPFKKTCKVINNFLYNENTWCQNLFIHIREPEEIQRLKDKYSNRAGCDVHTILVYNPNVPLVTGNHADEGVYEYDYDILISNDGTLEELENTAKHFCREFCR